MALGYKKWSFHRRLNTSAWSRLSSGGYMKGLVSFLRSNVPYIREDIGQSKQRWRHLGLVFLPYFLLAISAAAQSGTIKPKYIVVSVIYAPPGKSSSVDYGSSTKLGTSTQFD